MKPVIDKTHDPSVHSWVEAANDPASDFPIQNLPFGLFRHRDRACAPRVGVAIGDCVLDLSGLQKEGVLDEMEALHTADASVEHSAGASLDALMALSAAHRVALRHHIHSLLQQAASSPDREVVSRHLLPQDQVNMLVPANVGDYTDFYASIFHATNVGKLFRPDNPLLPNYKYIPIGYHGRASSLVVSNTPIRRPCGQTRDGNADPKFGPTRALDYELEVGFFVGAGNEWGTRVPIADAADHIFGICLVNDWSARDIQAWEYQPLGPFLGKSFGTSLSPWVVTIEALAPFRTSAFARPAGDPAPLAYLFDADDQLSGGLDVKLDVSLQSVRMRQAGIPPVVLSRSNSRDLYWTMAQMLAHHASNGCNLRAGDLLASGTVSGPDEDSRGCLLELTSRGQYPITLPSGEQRKFLEDGDEVTLHGFCESKGFRRIGLGECRGRILPASSE